MAERRRKRKRPSPRGGVGSSADAPAHQLPFLVVGIGASAGGLEAFEKFFAHMPADSGLAFVLVPHLDARQKSSMVELLQRRTAMDVVEIADGMTPAPNRVHIIPPNGTLTLERGTLQVATPRDQPATIDTFFRSLAEAQADNAVGVVLSGSGSDGSLGIKAIKQHGGLTVAQALESSRFDSMPHSAAATGLVDLVLPVEEIPAKLVEYARRVFKTIRAPGGAYDADLRRHKMRICTLLRARTGHDFSRYKEGTFSRRVQRRMHVVGLSSAEEYVQLLRKDKKEVDLLFRDLLIGVTQFFRDEAAFDALANAVIAPVVAGKSADDFIRIWVAGCATGEEAYSIGILVREQLAHASIPLRANIFATDIDEEALAVARAGLYPEAIAHNISPERLARFFTREGSSYRVSKDIREMCVFSVHNLINDAPFSKLDLISCRNLLIYLDGSLQDRILPLLHWALRPGGYLFLGSSENTTLHDKLFTKVDAKYRIFKSRAVKRERPVADVPLGVVFRPVLPAVAKPAEPQTGESDVSRRAMRMMESYVPAYVVLDEHHDVVHFSGRTGRYLQPTPGAASLNLFSILDPSLRPEVRAVLNQAAATGEKAVQANVRLPGSEGVQRTLEVIAQPLPPADGEARHFLLAFHETGAAGPADDAVTEERTEDQKDQMIGHLQRELRATQERLQATVEELETSNEETKASNEEFQSVNEELQASNEELETSKEELQSVNEELETVNSELSAKVEALERANDDRKNLLENTQIATVFLDGQLRIKHFTPAIADVFHMVETDHGRPIGHVATRVAYANIERDARQVLQTLIRKESEVARADGTSLYLMRILPYRTVANVVDGVVITFIDITERKRAEENLARLAAIAASSRDAIIGLTSDGTITSWNEGAEQIYGYASTEAVGRSLSFLFPRERTEDLRAIVDRGKKPRVAEPFEMERVRKDGARIVVASTVSPVRDPAGKIAAVSAIERDITPQKHAEERQRMLLAELNHRVKNTLATVLSLLRQSLRHALTTKDFSRAFEGRIRALAKSHDLLAASNWAGADLEVLVVTALAPYRERGDRVVVSGEKVTLNAPAALLLGMILHELATNAAKHGALSNDRGQVEVAWSKSARTKRLELSWTEKKGPRVDQLGKTKGFGLTLIERGLAHELKGNSHFEVKGGGIRWSMDMPLAEIEAEGSAVMPRRRRP